VRRAVSQVVSESRITAEPRRLDTGEDGAACAQAHTPAAHATTSTGAADAAMTVVTGLDPLDV
jgi:hypothetical protein